MAVYVDNARLPYGRMVMCHMWADTQRELFDMAVTIGVNLKWVQRPPAASWLHFDIARSKRALAIKAGAIETERYGPLEHVARLAGDREKLDRIARLREQFSTDRFVGAPAEVVSFGTHNVAVGRSAITNAYARPGETYPGPNKPEGN